MNLYPVLKYLASAAGWPLERIKEYMWGELIKVLKLLLKDYFIEYG